MNTIPSIGPDTAIAPRTGSASPQTPPQQRTDAAPAVIADDPSAAADPGVMLKITPPVQPRQGDPKVIERDQNSALSQLASLLSDPDVVQIASISESAKEADEAVQKRVALAFAALPADVQEAIRLASTPAIAKLLRLAALTAPAIREAPAILHTGVMPMADQVGEAVEVLRQVLQQAPPFKLAQFLQELGKLRVAQSGFLHQAPHLTQPRLEGQMTGFESTLNQSWVDSPQAVQSKMLAQVRAGQPTPNLQMLQREGGPLEPLQVGQPRPDQMPGQTEEGDLESLQAVQRQPLQAGQQIQEKGLAVLSEPLMRQQSGASEAGSQHDLPEGEQSTSDESRREVSTQQTVKPSLTSTSEKSVGMPGTGGVLLQAPDAVEREAGRTFTNLAITSPLEALNGRSPEVHGGSVSFSPQFTEAAIRDGLRLIMDGRMLWQGQLTPGVPMQFERSDAWITNQQSLGGMEKGTSLKVKLHLPNIGPLEVRAMGFGGQVSVRLYADSGVTASVADALPDLQARLKARGLAGTQVLVDSL